ncbi:hypothetical protein [Pseudaestuariivita sp.]|uniref:hypothetical protein n=1 Tax=Pseudaestuariivita sp. TaxID=2211669 RepID=UPI00405A2B3A
MELSGKLRDVVAAVAPTLAAALGGPLAGAAVGKIGQVLLNDAGASVEAIEDLLRRPTPEALAALRKLDTEFDAEMKRLDVELERIDAGDRASARDRQAKMRDWTPSVLGGLILLGFFGVLAALMWLDLPAGGADVVKIMLGALGAMTTQVGNYFFGSSRGSAAKNDIIAQLKGVASPEGREAPRPGTVF